MSKLLIKFPTRNRPDRFFEVLDFYLQFVEDEENTEILITMDSDDLTMNCDIVKDKLKKIKKQYNFIRWNFGESESKIDAINRDLETKDFDILMLASDDMFPELEGFDNIVRNDMEKYYKDFDGCLWYNDGYTHKKLNTLSILGKKYFDRLGYIYYPEYKSLWCDNEYTETAKLLNKIIYLDKVIVKHEHPYNNKKYKMDDLYHKNESDNLTDKRLFLQRKKIQFDVFKHWSILICSLQKRIQVREKLINKLKRQIYKSNLQDAINIMVNLDDGVSTIGKKRNELIKKCYTPYCCFIDDDDDISDTYIKDIWDGIKIYDIDVVSLNGIMYLNNKLHKPFVHSIDYNSYFEKDNVYYRPPNHLNPMKTKFFRKFEFPEKNYGEDTDFAMELCNSKLLQTEYKIEKPYYFYIYNDKK